MTSERQPEPCPKCGSDLKGEPIPEKDRESFGGAEFFSRRIAHYCRDVDATVAWECPDCEHVWPRYDWMPQPPKRTREQ